MAAHFYPIKIKSVKKETADCVAISFDIPETLKETFAYKQGQHLTIRATLNGVEIRRNYSLFSSPLSNEWSIAIKQVEGGLFSSHANGKLQAGDELEVMPPMGRFFTPLNKTNKKNYLFIAAGSGITPILSIIKTTLLTELQSTCTLLYANRSRDTVIFKDTIDALKNTFMNRLSVHHIFSREKLGMPVYEGRIDAGKCDLLFSKLINLERIDDCFICGPASMIDTIKNYLERKGFDKQKIHYELFTAAGATVVSKTHTGNPKKEDGKSATIVIKLDGRESSFKLDYEGESILDAALKRGADLPYACKGGVCCTCKALLREGRVTMDLNYGLEEEEVAAGYVLTCQSHPLSEKVVVDFDSR